MTIRSLEQKTIQPSLLRIEDLRYQGKWKDALAFLSDIAISAKDASPEIQIIIYLHTARILKDQASFGMINNINDRNDVLDKAFKLAKRIQNNALLGDVYDAMGSSLHTSYLQGDRKQEPQMEMKYFKRGLELRSKYGTNAKVAESTFHIGLVYDVIRKEHDKALQHHREAYKLAIEAENNLIASNAIRHIGFALLKTEDFTGAARAFAESLELRETARFIPGVAVALSTLAQIKVLEGNSADALTMFNKSKELFSTIGAESRVAWLNSQIAEIDDQA